jgi:small subunit ribosomal protein S3
MGNKINPVGFRLGVNKTPSARWYASFDNYPKLLQEDELIRSVVLGEVGHSGVSRIDIERAAHNINITIHTAKPGVVIGRGGDTIKDLRAKLDSKLTGTIGVNVVEVANPNTNAALIAQRIAEQLERRFAFRRAMKQAVQRTMESGAQGVKVRCSGRLGGSEQARPEWYSDGRVPLQTLRADIDYGTAEAKTTYGIIGVKAWVFNGEIVGDSRRRAAVLPRGKKDEDKRRRRARPQARRSRGDRPERPSRSRENN